MKKINYLLLILLLPTFAFAKIEDHFTLGGDFRYRFEQNKDESKTAPDDEAYVRQRYRTRISLGAEVSERTKVQFRLASGGSEPTSTNHTIGNEFVPGGLYIDQAYINYTPSEKSHFYFGRMKNPYYRAGKNALLFDSDVNPEGIAFTFKRDYFFLNLGSHTLTESKTANKDVGFSSVQLAGTFSVANMDFTIGGSQYSFSNVKGSKPNSGLKGNTDDGSGNFLYDYKITEYFFDLSTKIMKLPLSVYATVASNSEVDDDNKASEFGLKVGKAKKENSYQFSVAQRKLEKDATIGYLTDGDHGGGGTNNSGLVAAIKYAFTENTSLSLTHFNSKKDITTNGKEDTFTKSQLDLVVKF